MKEHLGGIYEFLQSRKIESLNELGAQSNAPEEIVPIVKEEKKVSYEERKESGKKKNKIEKVLKDSERKIEKMESRLKELEKKLCTPEAASDMKLCGEYTATKKDLDQEVEKWERLSEELESLE